MFNQLNVGLIIFAPRTNHVYIYNYNVINTVRNALVISHTFKLHIICKQWTVISQAFHSNHW